MLFSKTCFAVLSALLDSRSENDPCRYYCDLSRFAESVDVDDSFWEKYLLPNVYLWDPLSQIEGCTLKCPLCMEDGRSNVYLKQSGVWEKGNKTASIPRRLWDDSWFCALVGRSYRCSSHHDVRSYHAGVLKQLSSDQIPFVLSHETGMMTSYLDNSLRLMEEKCNFYQIRCITSKLFCDTYMRRKMLCRQAGFPDINDIFKTTTPSEYLIKLGFLNYFKLNYWKYAQHFTDIPVKSLICDFAFHEKATIGYAKDRKWTSTHDSLFLTANEYGKIKSFKLTLGTEFDQVMKMLTIIAGTVSGIDVVCVDNCCGLREILSEIFPSAEIKLHPSHALKRLLNCVPSNHPSFDAFSKDLHRIFRKKNDYYLNRHQVTPQSSTIMENLIKCLEKWNSLNDENWCLFTPTFASEIESIKNHISNGCLSNIPPDNYQEKIKLLNEHLSTTLLGNRYSFANAQAILTNIIYSLNSKYKQRQNFKTKDYHSLLPIWSIKYPYINKGVMLIENGAEVASVANENSDEVMEACLTLQQLRHVGNNQRFSEINITDISMKKIICLTNALTFLDSFFQSGNLETFLDEKKPFKSIDTLASPVMKLNDFFSQCKHNELISIKELSKVFVKEGYGIAETKQQGFILCLELLLRDLLLAKNLPDGYLKKLETILNSGNATENIIEVLTKELNSERKQQYTDIYNENYTVKENVNKPTDDMINSFELHDIFPFIASNAFNIIIVIIPLCHNTPLFPIFPEELIAEDSNFIIFDPSDNLFLPVIKIPNFSPTHIVSVKISDKSGYNCACGVNDKSRKVRCSHGRCPCMKRSSKCSNRCRCKGCQNGRPDIPDEKAEESSINSVRSLTRRKRQSHALSLKTFSSIEQYGNVNASDLSKLKEILIQSVFYVDVAILICKLEDIEVHQINEIFMTYFKIFLQKLQELEYDNQDVLDALFTFNKCEIEKWIVSNKYISIVHQTWDEPPSCKKTSIENHVETLSPKNASLGSYVEEPLSNQSANAYVEALMSTTNKDIENDTCEKL